MKITLDFAKKYLRSDDDEDDDIIQFMMSATEQCIIDSVGEYDPENPKANILYLAILQDMYDNRKLIADAPQNLSRVMGSITLQLQCSQMAKDDSESEGDSNA